VDEFWNLIGSNSIRDDDEIDTVLRRISGQLKAMTPDDLFRFHDQLCEALFVIDRREFAEVPARLKNGDISEIPQSDDYFLYARCACVLAGRDVYGAILKSGIGFDRFAETFAQKAEGLLYLAMVEYENKTGAAMSAMDLRSCFPVDTGSNDQAWD
jgi:hypothetical protein